VARAVGYGMPKLLRMTRCILIEDRPNRALRGLWKASAECVAVRGAQAALLLRGPLSMDQAWESGRQAGPGDSLALTGKAIGPGVRHSPR